MTERTQEESQQELFLEFSGESAKVERFPSIPKAQKPVLISTSAEQIILTGILSILALCLVFFLGVLRGRGLEQAKGLEPTTPRMATPAPEPRIKAPSAAAPRVLKQAEPLKTPAELSKPYTIVLATYKKQSLAEREAELLKKAGQPAFVTGSGDYFVICVGHYANIGEAKKDLKYFGGKYKGCYLKRR